MGLTTSFKTFILYFKKNCTMEQQKNPFNASSSLFLISGIDFEGSTIGLATMYAMCSTSSGAVNEVFLWAYVYICKLID